MISTILIQAIISLIIIIILHYLFDFFKENLTTPKIRDLVTKPNEEYKKIYEKLKTKKDENILDNEEKEEMKNKLKKYMQSLSLKKNENNEELKEVNDNNIIELTSFDINNSTNNFSSF
jgi:uncharacterized protein YecA (UPF0149 family)